MSIKVKDVLELFEFDACTKIALVELDDCGGTKRMTKPKPYQDMSYKDISKYLDRNFYNFRIVTDDEDGEEMYLAINYLDPYGEWK